MILRLLPILLCFFCTLPSLPAQTLVADISQANEGSRPSDLQANDSYAAWFAATPGGIQLYYLAPGMVGPGVFPIARDVDLPAYAPALGLAGKDAYFVIYGNGRARYYRADLDAKTLTAVADLPSAGAGSFDPLFTGLGESVLFIHRDADYQFHLYRTDGSAGNSESLSLLPENKFVKQAYRLGDHVFLEYSYRPREKIPYIISDGTPAGTRVYEPRGDLSFVGEPLDAGLGTLVSGVSPLSVDVYRLDLTTGETSPLREWIPELPSGRLSHFRREGPSVYFVRTDTAYAISLWKVGTDTRKVTELVDLNPTRDTVSVRELHPTADGVYYRLYHSRERRYSLNRTDGTVGGTATLHADTETFRYPHNRLVMMVSSGKYQYFPARQPGSGIEMWRTDGTLAGTQLIEDMYPGNDSSDPEDVLPWRDGVLFTAESPAYGREVFFTDGSGAGTDIVVDANGSQTSSYPLPHAIVNDLLVFRATTPCTGFELFATDGTAGNTRLLKDVEPGRESSHVYVSGNAENGDGVFVHQKFTDQQAYRTDGSPGGTVRLNTSGGLGKKRMISEPGIIGGKMFFRIYTAGTGHALYEYVAPADTFRLIKVIHPGAAVRIGGNPFVALNDEVLLFRDSHPEKGYELWRTDGTAQGTYVVKDIRQVDEDYTKIHIGHPVVSDGIAYFLAAADQDGIWRTDGTESGTWQLSGAYGMVNPGQPFIFDGQVYFVAGGYRNKKLYTTRGERFDVRPSPTTSDQRFHYLGHPVPFGTRLAFAATTEEFGDELWVAPDADSPAVAMGDLFAGPDHSYPRDLFALNDSTLLFSVELPELGREMWSTDGTPEATLLVADINPGTASGNPQNFYRYGEFVYFSADDGVSGSELWKYSPLDLDNDGYIGADDTDESDPLVNVAEPDDPSVAGVNCSPPERSTTSVHEAVEVAVRIYPNPTAETVTVESGGHDPLLLELYSSDGRRVLQIGAPQGGTQNLNLSHLPPGDYLLLVRDEQSGTVSDEWISVIR